MSETATAERPQVQENEQLKTVITPTVARISLAAFQPEALVNTVETSPELRQQWVEGNAGNLRKVLDAGDVVSWNSRKENTSSQTGTTDEKITAWERSFLENAQRFLADTAVDSAAQTQRKEALKSLGLSLDTTESDNMTQIQEFRKKYVHEDRSNIDAFAEDLAQGCLLPDGSVDLKLLTNRLDTIKPILSVFGNAQDASTLVYDLAVARTLAEEKKELKRVEVLVLADAVTTPLDTAEVSRLKSLKDAYDRLPSQSPEPAPAEPLPEVRGADQPLSEEELTFAMNYLTYNDVDPQTRDEARIYLEETAQFGQEYTRELIELFRKYGRENILSTANTRVRELQDILSSMNIEGTQHSRSPSWYLWHAAKESYLAQHPDIQASLPNGDKYHPANPFAYLSEHPTDAAIIESVTADQGIFHTMLGYEMSRDNQRHPHQFMFSLQSHGLTPEEHQRLYALSNAEEGTPPHLPSYVMREIGEIVDLHAGITEPTPHYTREQSLVDTQSGEQLRIVQLLDSSLGPIIVLQNNAGEKRFIPEITVSRELQKDADGMWSLASADTSESESRRLEREHPLQGVYLINKDNGIKYSVTEVTDNDGGGKSVTLQSPDGSTISLNEDLLRQHLQDSQSRDNSEYIRSVWRLAKASEDELQYASFAAAKTLKNEKGMDHEDRILFEPEYRSFAVFDGLGGEDAGAIGAQSAKDFFNAAVKQIPDGLRAEDTASYIQTLATMLSNELSKDSKRGMTTLTFGYIHETADGVKKLITVNVGDSRLYRLRNNSLECITTDNEYTGKEPGSDEIRARQRARQIELADLDTPEDFSNARQDIKNAFQLRNRIEQALGNRIVEPAITISDIQEGDAYLLTSDGVHDNLTDKQIEAILQAGGTPLKIVEDVVNKARLKARDTSRASIRSKKDDISADYFIITADMPAKRPTQPVTEHPTGDNFYAQNYAEIRTGMETIGQAEQQLGRPLTAAEKWFVLFSGADRKYLQYAEQVYRAMDSAIKNKRDESNYQKIRAELTDLQNHGQQGTSEYRDRYNKLKACTIYLSSMDAVETYLSLQSWDEKHKKDFRSYYRERDEHKQAGQLFQIGLAYTVDDDDVLQPKIKSEFYVNEPTPN